MYINKCTYNNNRLLNQTVLKYTDKFDRGTGEQNIEHWKTFYVHVVLKSDNLFQIRNNLANFKNI